MNARAIVYKMLDEDEPTPEHYLSKVPPKIDREAVLNQIRDEAGDYCLDVPDDRKQFAAWLDQNAHLFPDIVKAVAVVNANSSWCTDNEDDMDEFLLALGFPRPDNTCPRCEGSGEEPGAPSYDDADGNEMYPVCDRCHGVGTLPVQNARTFR